MESGKVYSFGAFKNGQLGILAMHGSVPAMPGSLDTARYRFPCHVHEQLSNQRVVTVAAGLNHSLAMTDDGKCFAWGLNDCGQFGLGDATAACFPQRIVGMKSERIVLVTSCCNHTLAVGANASQKSSSSDSACTVS